MMDVQTQVLLNTVQRVVTSPSTSLPKNGKALNFRHENGEYIIEVSVQRPKDGEKINEYSDTAEANDPEQHW